MPALRDFARDQLAIAEERGSGAGSTETERLGAGRVRRGGQEYVSFSCNDYLGLTHHPAVIAAARRRSSVTVRAPVPRGWSRAAIRCMASSNRSSPG